MEESSLQLPQEPIEGFAEGSEDPDDAAVAAAAASQFEIVRNQILEDNAGFTSYSDFIDP
jgi:hypothetical protein